MKWTTQGQTPVVQGSAVPILEIQMQTFPSDGDCMIKRA